MRAQKEGVTELIRSKKSRITGCAARLRSRDAVLRSLARRGRFRAEQGDTTVLGVCGNWITKCEEEEKERRIAVSFTLSRTVPSGSDTADQPSSA